MYQNRRYFQLVPIERSRVIMSLPPHQGPLAPTPSHLGREYQIQAFLEYIYHAWFHPILRCVSCSSIVHPNKSHLLLRCLKIHGVYLSGMPCEHRLRLRNTRFRSIPVSWAMATTGKPRKNQCKILAHSCRVKCKDNFLGFHS